MYGDSPCWEADGRARCKEARQSRGYVLGAGVGKGMHVSHKGTTLWSTAITSQLMGEGGAVFPWHVVPTWMGAGPI